MIHQEILDKEEIVYCLLYSYNDVNTLIPIKGQIKDIKFDHENPLYQIKLEQIYDNIFFIKKHIFNMRFYTKFDQRKALKIPFKNCDSIDSFNNQLIEKDIRVVMPSLMCFSKKKAMLATFDKLNYYLIMRHLESFRDSVIRTPYRGFLRMSSTIEFNERLEKFIGDMFENGKEKEIDVTLKDVLFDLERSLPLDAKVYPNVNKKPYNINDRKKQEN